MTIDGTNCHIFEQSPFDTKLYTHKCNPPDVRYELGVSIGNGNVMWVNEPFTCAPYPDRKTFDFDLKKRLLSDEQFIADRTYKSQSFVNPVKNYDRVSSRLLARHETLNRRIQTFNVLSTLFRHHVVLHSFCFFAIANDTQLMIKDCGPCF